MSNLFNNYILKSISRNLAKNTQINSNSRISLNCVANYSILEEIKYVNKFNWSAFKAYYCINVKLNYCIN